MIKRRKRILSLVLTLAMTLECLPAQAGTESGATSGPLPEQIDSNTVWSYLDDNTDPAGDSTAEGYHRTSWTTADFDDSSWKTAAGPFGSKKGGAELESGYTAKTVLAGCDGANDTPAYFLRADFNVDSLEGMTQLLGTLQYDGGVILYINGQRVAAFDDNACNANGASLNHGFDANLQYGGSHSDRTGSSVGGCSCHGRQQIRQLAEKDRWSSESSAKKIKKK